MKFIIVDAASLFHRSFHVVHGDAYTKAGMALHIIFNSLSKVFRKFNGDHVVMCDEGKSWRYDFFPQYKSNRKLLKENRSEIEKEEHDAFFEVLKDFMEFMKEKTRSTVLRSPITEADDLIARFIELHPNDEHIIISGDSDMIQLIDDNVTIYNGVSDLVYTKDGVFNDKDEPMLFSIKPQDGKIRVGDTLSNELKKRNTKIKEEIKELNSEIEAVLKITKSTKKDYDQSEKNTIDEVNKKRIWEEAEGVYSRKKIELMKLKSDLDAPLSHKIPKNWHKLSLFIKCIRGDKSDSIFSAYPGVRYEGTSKKIGIIQAWDDMVDKGFNWNNFMLQTWEKLLPDGSIKSVEVGDEYQFNRLLIDLKEQPDYVKESMDEAIIESIQKKPVGMVGIHFLQFCGRYDLKRVADRAKDHIEYLGASYK